MSLNGTLRLNTSFTNTKDDVDLSSPSENISQSAAKNVAAGKLYHDTLTLDADSVTIIDLNDGSLEDVFGDVVEMTEITSLYVKGGAENSVDVVLSGGVDAFLSDQPAIGASEGLGFLTNIDISTDSKMYFVNGALSGTVDLIVTGNE